MMATLLNGVSTRRLASIWAIRRRLASWRFASHGAIPRTVLLSARIWLRRTQSMGRAFGWLITIFEGRAPGVLRLQ